MSKRLELAERLKRFRPGPDDHYLDQAADLLREDDTLIAELEAENERLLEGTVKAVLDAVPGRQDKDQIARCLQDKYGPWWHDKSQIRRAALDRRYEP